MMAMLLLVSHDGDDHATPGIANKLRLGRVLVRRELEQVVEHLLVLRDEVVHLVEDHHDHVPGTSPPT